MAGLTLKNVYKIYDIKPEKKNKGGKADKEKKTFKAVDNFTMEIADNEFVVFVGPSGCGKSTTLRMIAGLEEISSGEIYIGDKLVNDVPSKDRDIAMVFQNYALYPHMTVYDNIAIALKLRKIAVEKLDENGNKVFEIDKKKIKQINSKLRRIRSLKAKVTEKEDIEVVEAEEQKALKELDYYTNTPVQVYSYVKMSKQEIDEKVKNAARMLDIEGQLNKRPREMSGGQRQRVALGRAMVRSPKVFLLDEPLSNLDAKLRATMRVEISALHKKLGTTFIYVTHDQVEAMTMGTRIVVMKGGVIQQIDTPNNLFDYPINKFVAGFIGTPQMNFFDATLCVEGKNAVITLDGGYTQSVPLTKLNRIQSQYLDGQSHPVTLGVRGENVIIGDDGLTLRVNIVEALGSESYIYASRSTEESQKISDEEKDIIIKIQQRCNLQTGDIVHVRFEDDKIHIFDRASEISVFEREEKND